MTIVTIGRGAQSASPFAYNAGETDVNRGCALFDDFYTVDMVGRTDFNLVDSASGVLANTAGADVSHFGTSQKVFQSATGRSFSAAIRLKLVGQNASDSVQMGLAPNRSATLVSQSDHVGFTITQGAASSSDVIRAVFSDGTDSESLVIPLSILSDGFAATDWHTYGFESSRVSDGGSVLNRARFYIDGKEVGACAGTGSAMAGTKLICYQPIVTTLAHVDWISFNMPRT